MSKYNTTQEERRKRARQPITFYRRLDDLADWNKEAWELPDPESMAAAIKADARIECAISYPDGFVPLSYKWRAPGTRIVFMRVDTDEHGLNGWSSKWTWMAEEYDRKRSFGRGPSWVCLSKDGGVLASG